MGIMQGLFRLRGQIRGSGYRGVEGFGGKVSRGGC